MTQKEKIFHPIRIIRENIEATEVAKYYLKVEFSKIFKNISDIEIDNSINAVKDKNIWGLLEAISFTYHLNGVFYNIAKEEMTWKEEVWKVEDLVLTGMDSNVNKVIFSPEISGDSVKFKEYLQRYFSVNDPSDPENLSSYKPTNKDIYFDKVILKFKEGRPHMLDGSHRLTEMLLNGVQSVHAFIGYKNSDVNEDKLRTKFGKSIHILLTILYKKGDSNEKAAIINACSEIIRLSTDGRDNFKRFWIDQQRDEEIKAAGQKLLEITTQTDKTID